MRRKLLVSALAFALISPSAAFAISRAQDAGTPAPASATPAPDVYAQITTEVFANAAPAPVADGQLALALVTVPAGAKIASHIHPGSQFAAITQGELTYTVDNGTVLHRKAGSPADGPWDEITSGETVVLEPGDSVRENPGEAHHAENAGDEPVLIWIASLFPNGASRALPAATPQS